MKTLAVLTAYWVSNCCLTVREKIGSTGNRDGELRKEIDALKGTEEEQKRQ